MGREKEDSGGTNEANGIGNGDSGCWEDENEDRDGGSGSGGTGKRASPGM